MDLRIGNIESMPRRVPTDDPFTNAALVKIRGVRLPSVCSAENALARLRIERARFGIVEAKGRFVGLVWTNELASACGGPEAQSVRVSSFFDSSANPVMAFGSATVSARQMIRSGAKAVPVLDDRGYALGVLTLEDFAEAFASLRLPHRSTRDVLASKRAARWTI